MDKMKKCPYCGEDILAVAKKCKYCGEWLNDEMIKSGMDIHSNEITTDKNIKNNKSVYGFFQYYFLDAFVFHYFDFKGKINRKQYWFGVLTYSLLLILASSIGMMISETVSLIVQTIVSLFFFIPGLALCVRRLRDIGKNPWWVLVSVVPLIGIIWLLILMCKKGESKNEIVKTKTVDIIIWIISTILFVISIFVIFKGDITKVNDIRNSDTESSIESFEESNDAINLTSPSGIKWTITAIMNDFTTSYKVNSKFGDIASLTDKKNSLEFDIRDFDYNEAKLFLKIGADGYGKAMQSRLLVIDLNTGEFENEYGNADTHAIKLDKEYGIATFYDFDNNKISEIAYK